MLPYPTSVCEKLKSCCILISSFFLIAPKDGSLGPKCGVNLFKWQVLYWGEGQGH